MYITLYDSSQAFKPPSCRKNSFRQVCLFCIAGGYVPTQEADRTLKELPPVSVRVTHDSFHWPEA